MFFDYLLTLLPSAAEIAGAWIAACAAALTGAALFSGGKSGFFTTWQPAFPEL